MPYNIIFLVSFSLMSSVCFSNSLQKDTCFSCTVRYSEVTDYGTLIPLEILIFTIPFTIMESKNYDLQLCADRFILKKKGRKKEILISKIKSIQMPNKKNKRHTNIYIEMDTLITNLYNYKTPIRYSILIPNSDFELFKQHLSQTKAPAITICKSFGPFTKYNN